MYEKGFHPGAARSGPRRNANWAGEANKVRILFLSPRQALPLRNGAKLREYHFLRALGSVAEVSYLYFAEPGSDPLTTRDLPFCRDVIGVPKPRAYGYVKTALGILGKTPLPVLNYTSAA